MIDAARRCCSPHLNRVEVQPSSHGEERSARMDMAASGGLRAAPSSTGENGNLRDWESLHFYAREWAVNQIGTGLNLVTKSQLDPQL
jgi:hypothetical protein